MQMRRALYAGAGCLLFVSSKAQINIDTSALVPMIAATYAYQFSGGDLVNRFGNSSCIGASFSIKTVKKWIFGIEGNFIFGNRVKENRILNNITTSEGKIIEADGTLSDVNLFERGYLITARSGKLFSCFGSNANSGLIALIGTGFLQHKIRIESNAPQLSGNYKKGYDRLSNGLVVSGFLGYQLMGNRRLINFFGGIEFIQAFTQNRRTYDFDMMKKDEDRRIDILTGIKAGWIIPFYKRIPDAYYYH